MEGEAIDMEIEAPKLAPLYTAVEVQGDGPGPRCGHTLTAVSMGGEGNSGCRLILFGGATALESSGGASAGGAAGISEYWV